MGPPPRGCVTRRGGASETFPKLKARLSPPPVPSSCTCCCAVRLLLAAGPGLRLLPESPPLPAALEQPKLASSRAGLLALLPPCVCVDGRRRLAASPRRRRGQSKRATLPTTAGGHSRQSGREEAPPRRQKQGEEGVCGGDCRVLPELPRRRRESWRRSRRSRSADSAAMRARHGGPRPPPPLLLLLLAVRGGAPGRRNRLRDGRGGRRQRHGRYELRAGERTARVEEKEEGATWSSGRAGGRKAATNFPVEEEDGTGGPRWVPAAKLACAFPVSAVSRRLLPLPVMFVRRPFPEVTQ